MVRQPTRGHGMAMMAAAAAGNKIVMLLMEGANAAFLRGYFDNFAAISAIQDKNIKLKRSTAGPICGLLERSARLVQQA